MVHIITCYSLTDDQIHHLNIILHDRVINYTPDHIIQQRCADDLDASSTIYGMSTPREACATASDAGAGAGYLPPIDASSVGAGGGYLPSIDASGVSAGGGYSSPSDISTADVIHFHRNINLSSGSLLLNRMSVDHLSC